MSDVEEQEIFAPVRTGRIDEKDRMYPPRPADGSGALLRPKERFLLEVFEHRIDPLPDAVGYDYYKERAEPTRFQRGEECTGFALAAVADFHLRKGFTAEEWAAMSVESRQELTTSRRMLYEMAQELDGADYRTGSTLRGALKGWKRVGAASEAAWPYHPNDEQGQVHGRLTLGRVFDAYARPGGPYYRIAPADSPLMKDALARRLPLYAVVRKHVGWYRLYMTGSDGVIEKRADDKLQGGHAIVIVGYDERGLWIHNSWGAHWGLGGFGLVTWDDWQANGLEVWCVIPPSSPRKAERPSPRAAPDTVASTHSVMWRHVVTIGDDGRVAGVGPYGMDDADIKTQLYLFGEETKHWTNRRLAVFADGGYWPADVTVELLRPFRDRLMAAEIYPIFLIWDRAWLDDTEAWLLGELDPDRGDAARTIDELREIWADRGGQVMANVMFAESIARRVWHELRQRSVLACREGGAATRLAESIHYKWDKRDQRPFDIHLMAHGVGDHLMMRLAPSLPTPITSCNLWAPATTIADFRSSYEPRLGDRRLRKMTVTTLDDDAERAETFGPMPASLLSLVADVLAVPDLDLDQAVVGMKDGPQWRRAPEPVLGMERFLTNDARIGELGDLGLIDIHPVGPATHTTLAGDAGVQNWTIDIITAQPSVTDEVVASRNAPVPSTPVEPPEPSTIRDPLARAMAAMRGRS